MTAPLVRPIPALRAPAARPLTLFGPLPTCVIGIWSNEDRTPDWDRVGIEHMARAERLFGDAP